MIHLVPDIREVLPDDDPFSTVLTLTVTPVRRMPGRLTGRIQLGERHCFLKTHYGVGWRSILADFIRLRWPVVSARNEWQAIQQLQSLGLATAPLLGYGWRGWNPATRRSFVLTEALTDTLTLQEFIPVLASYPSRQRLQRRRQLIIAVADILRTLHDAGLNHRDFYLCHLRLQQPVDWQQPQLHVMDLHRMQSRQRVPYRWRLKDLAALYFSSWELALSRTDRLRFIRRYLHPSSLRQGLCGQGWFWWLVAYRARRIRKREQRRRGSA